MNDFLEKKLVYFARILYTNHDPAHDFDHILRVCRNAKQIAKVEGGDIDIIITSALFHDTICYPKSDVRRKHSADESGDLIRELLCHINEFPQDKIRPVVDAIQTCSLFNGKDAVSLEGKILQDADGLEATGAIEIMRTFSTSGIMRNRFYDPNDPFAENRELNDMRFAIDHFYTRSLKMIDRMNTQTAKIMALKRVKFMKEFLEQVKLEISGVL